MSSGGMGSSGDKQRLSVMPTSVLMPRLGDLGDLVGYAENLRARLEVIQASDDEGSQDDVRKRLGEEGMLVQVLQWLNVGEGAEEG